MTSFGPRIDRAMVADDQRAQLEAKRAKDEAAAAAETAESRNLALYQRQAEERGEHVSALAIARGEVPGRTMGAVFAAAEVEADKEDARERARKKREDGELVYVDEPVLVNRSSWPESEYELDRLVRQAQDDRTWIQGYAMRAASRQGRAAEHIEGKRAESEARRGVGVSRSQQRSYGEITRSAPEGTILRVY